MRNCSRADAQADHFIRSGQADLVLLARKMLRDPGDFRPPETLRPQQDQPLAVLVEALIVLTTS